jgi:hypothetical protein
MSQAGTILPPGGAAGGILKVDGDVGSAVPTVLGEIIIEGGTSAGGVATNINTIASVNTVEICLNNSISQPNTNATGTTGMYSLGGNTFMHNYGFHNTFLGSLSGNLALTSAGTTAIGYNACRDITSANGCTASGDSSQINLTTGYLNTSYGFGSMEGSPAGNPQQNCAFGANSLQALTSGGYNVAVGNQSHLGVTTGSKNCGLGYNSLSQVITGASNLALGYGAGVNYVGAESSNVLVHNWGVVGDNNTIRIGTQGAGDLQQNLCYIAGIVGVTTANSQDVTINSSTGQLGCRAIQAITHWQTVGLSGALAVNNGYICTAGAALSFSLPATSSIGSMISLTLDGSTSWTITQGAGQSIRIGALETTPGVGGSLASAAQGDSVTMVCSVADTRWVVVSEIGTISVV